MKIKYFFSILFLSILLIFSGCSKEDCSTLDTTYKKYGFDEEQDKCIIIKSIEENKCGNGIAEESDGGACKCPKDVALTHPKFGCSGTLGDYLDKACVKNECVYSQNDKVIEQTKSIEMKNSDVVLESRVSLNTPFILNSADNNKIKYEVSLVKFPSTSSNIKDLTVKEIKIENSNGLLLGSVDVNQKLATIGSSVSKQIEISDTNKYSTTDTIKTKLTISYTKEYLDSKGTVTKTENKIETIVGTVGKYEIINPNFYEKEK